MTRVTFISVENRRTLYKKTLMSILLYGVCILLYGVYHCMEYINVWSILLYGVYRCMDYDIIWSMLL